MLLSRHIESVKLACLRLRHHRCRTGMALGVFDFCHAGHVNLLRRAADSCDRLIVGVHTDAAVQEYKGVRPLNSALERKARVEELGLADVVEIESDRTRLCRRHGVDVVFHGDDWNREAYVDHWGRDLVAELGVDIELLPHTPGVTSTGLRAKTPRIGWWLYSRNAEWDRTHIFDHLEPLYQRLGGVWIANARGRATVKRSDFEAACAWIPEGTPIDEVCSHVAALDLDVLITAHFNYDHVVEALEARGHPVSLIVLSHGRSGKPDTSDDARRRRVLRAPTSASCVTVYDWSFDDDSYAHFDRFLASGGSFANTAPVRRRPRLLVLPTWGPRADERGLLLSRRWRRALRTASKDWEVVISPHPLSDRLALWKLKIMSGIEILGGTGRSFTSIPAADAVLTEISGVFWESLLFDTPVLLAEAYEPPSWPADLEPTVDDVLADIPLATPDTLPRLLAKVRGSRNDRQHALAAQRLGTIDGAATERLADRIRSILTEAHQSSPKAQSL